MIAKRKALNLLEWLYLPTIIGRFTVFLRTTPRFLLMLLCCSCAELRDGDSASRVFPILHASSEETPVLSIPDVPGGWFSRLEISEDWEESKRLEKVCYTMVISNSSGKAIASETFGAHYGIEVDVLNLDQDGVPEFVVKTHIGPAIGPPMKELVLLRIRRTSDGFSFFDELLRMPLANQAGPSVGWWYEVEYLYRLDRGGEGAITIQLTLRHDPAGEWKEFIPQERAKVVALRGDNMSIAIGSHP